MQMPMEITWNSRLHRWLGAASIVTSGVCDADHPATPSPPLIVNQAAIIVSDERVSAAVVAALRLL